MLNLPPNPKWDIARVSHSTLVNADCFDVFPFIEDKSIDAIIADLPYGTTQNKWDSVLPLDEIWKQYKRILKPKGVVLLFAQIPFSITLGASNLKWLKYEWIWEKDRASGHLNAKKQPMKAHENILVFYEQIGTYNPQKTSGHKPSNVSGQRLKETTNYGKFEQIISGGQTDRYPRSVYKHNVVNSQHGIEHPTQKPLGLLEMLVNTYTNENEIVLDNTMGSGTTGLACLKTNRQFIGIEKEKQYYDVAVRRLSSYCGQRNANKRSMKATETYLILCQMDAGEITLKEAHELILRLFGVMESDCDHEWLNHSFDQFGFLQEQICDKCGAKQSVP